MFYVQTTVYPICQKATNCLCKMSATNVASLCSDSKVTVLTDNIQSRNGNRTSTREETILSLRNEFLQICRSSKDEDKIGNGWTRNSKLFMALQLKVGHGIFPRPSGTGDVLQIRDDLRHRIFDTSCSTTPLFCG